MDTYSNEFKCQSCGGKNFHLVKTCQTTLKTEVWIAPKKYCQDCGQIQGVWKIKLSVPSISKQYNKKQGF